MICNALRPRAPLHRCGWTVHKRIGSGTIATRKCTRAAILWSRRASGGSTEALCATPVGKPTECPARSAGTLFMEETQPRPPMSSPRVQWLLRCLGLYLHEFKNLNTPTDRRMNCAFCVENVNDHDLFWEEGSCFVLFLSSPVSCARVFICLSPYDRCPICQKGRSAKSFAMIPMDGGNFVHYLCFKKAVRDEEVPSDFDEGLFVSIVDALFPRPACLLGRPTQR